MGELLLERDDLEAATRHVQEGVELLLKWSELGVAAGRLARRSIDRAARASSSVSATRISRSVRKASKP